MTTRWLAIVTAAVLLGASCSGQTNAESQPAAPPPVQVGAENVVRAARDTIVSGPIVSGELKAAREATVRAQIGGAMTEVRVEEGQHVSRGQLLGRIEVSALGVQVRSAESAVRSADNQLEAARRDEMRTAQLVEAGALAQRDLDNARTAVSNAEAAAANARSQLAAARTELGNTVLRSPIDGVVADRAVGIGDVATTGMTLFTIVDPSSMRLDASVPSSDLSALRVGAEVEFTVRGYDKPFTGRIDRIAPQADPTTRQVPIYVSIPNAGGALVGGLFADGRVVTQSAIGVVVPADAVNTSEGTPWVLRVADGRAERARVMLGIRDTRTDRVQIVSGVQEGDILLRGASQSITPGTAVDVASPPIDASSSDT
jgi:RND family efflux transporter MFP subunit